MAKKSPAEDLLDRMQATGLRKKVAKTVSDAVAKAPGRKPPKGVDKLVADLKGLASEIEERVRPGSANGRKAKPRKAATAARRAATTTKATGRRKQTAAQRSAAAKKGARTRKANAAKK